MLSALWKYRQDNNAILDRIIVGIKFKIGHIEGSLKMNQHHIEGNRLGVYRRIEAITKCKKSSGGGNYE